MNQEIKCVALVNVNDPMNTLTRKQVKDAIQNNSSVTECEMIYANPSHGAIDYKVEVTVELNAIKSKNEIEDYFNGILKNLNGIGVNSVNIYSIKEEKEIYNNN